MDLATALRSEARRADERRLLVLTGEPAATRAAAGDALAATDITPEETAAVTPSDAFDCPTYDDNRADALLGTTREAIIYDCHERCEPNTLGKLVGAVDGGGLFVLLAPPLSEWPGRTDEFDRSLAVPPFEADEIGTAFRRRLVETLRAHRGVAVVRAEDGTVQQDGLTNPAPRPPRPAPDPPAGSEFPGAAYEQCRTQDQVDTVDALEALETAGNAVVVEADRGRGKSSAAGIAAGCLAAAGEDVLVTAPSADSTAALFDRAAAVLDELGVECRRDGTGHPLIETDAGRVRYAPPARASELPETPDRVIVDEAAALPVRILDSMLRADAAAFVTTIHGYEGAGRGFSVRFRDHLDDSDFDVRAVTMAEPIRYAPGDPIEIWSFRALALGARPPVEQLVESATPETVTHRELTTADLLDDEQLLGEVFGLLVLAHYRTEPNDLARLLDAPNVTVQALCHEDHVVSVALLAREGGLSPDLRATIYEGSRVRGNLVPDVLTGQLRDEAAGTTTGWRVLRIATHAAVRSRGLGSLLLDRVRASAHERSLDWLGVAYGATPALVAFWDDNDFDTVHLSTTRNERSGEHSAIMLDPLSTAGERLHERHTEWLHRRSLDAIRETLGDVDPETVFAATHATAGAPTLSLTDWEWRHVAGVSQGLAVFETAPGPARRLCYRHAAAPEEEVLSARKRRLLVRRVLQGQSWEQIRSAEGFHGLAACKRATAAALEPLVELYGTESAREELDRLR